MNLWRERVCDGGQGERQDRDVKWERREEVRNERDDMSPFYLANSIGFG